MVRRKKYTAEMKVKIVREQKIYLKELLRHSAGNIRSRTNGRAIRQKY